MPLRNVRRCDQPSTDEQVLRRDFGLQAYISHQVIPEAIKPYIHHYTNRWDPHDETTICYLILPSKLVSEEINMEDGHTEDGLFEATSVMSSLIDLDSLKIGQNETNRFLKAMKVLNLSPYVHPTQLQLRVDPFEQRHPPENVPGLGPVPQMQIYKRAFHKIEPEQQKRLIKIVADRVTRKLNPFEKCSFPLVGKFDILLVLDHSRLRGIGGALLFDWFNSQLVRRDHDRYRQFSRTPWFPYDTVDEFFKKTRHVSQAGSLT